VSTTARGRGRVHLKPTDSFDLIRLIARSQADPRKAVAELVQNSLDAGARTVVITWFSVNRRRAISVRDDGSGVFPDLQREEALRRLATTIGRSYKARLSPAERHQQMTLGKYGIGLLGFWSVGHHMQVRTRVAGSDTWVLRLEEEGREGELFPARRAHLPIEETFTEVTITDIHPAAEAQVKPRRLAAYLAGEMRGQLLSRDVRLEIHDRVGRGRALKKLVVRPQRYQGVPLGDLAELPVPGFASARVELYLVPEAEGRHGLVQLACGGATVLDDVGTIDGTDTPREPWSAGRFEGVVDFPDLEVAPSTRRGFVPNDAARALVAVLPELERRLREILEHDAERRKAEREADDARDIRRLFRPLARALPHYVLFALKDHDTGGRGEPLAGDAALGDDEGVALEGVATEDAPGPAPPAGTEFLFQPGPLASVEVRPRRSYLAVESRRRLKAIPRDADSRVLTEGVDLAWQLEGRGTLEASGAAAHYTSPPDPGRARIRVEARQGDRVVESFAEIVVSENVEPDDAGRSGVPDPEPVQAPAEPWRSRIAAGKWQYNVGHPDYRLVEDDQKRRLRYLTHLFAKEVVLRNFGEPGDAELLERMVEVLTHVGDAPPRRGG
jgi:hypothetical protein